MKISKGPINSSNKEKKNDNLKSNLKGLRKTSTASKIPNYPLQLKIINLSTLSDPLIEHGNDMTILSDRANSGKQISTP